ncbi:BQ2448_97 [Microbotryum intermedium]|uniref:BQ2448_97 protein n=1 Tax=Microbotryum intermedium TaxID=269621 RepID=A0A238FA62_9BASI|nr:BQ2448_97 [Microbotryum intermedium]
MSSPTSSSAFAARPALSSAASAALTSHGVPLKALEEACKGCQHQDSDELESYPKGFDVDLDSEMLGSVNHYGRQVLISTGKSDWEREVTDDADSLPGLLKHAYELATIRSDGGRTGTGLLTKAIQKLKVKKGENAPLPEGSVYKGVYPSIAAIPSIKVSTSSETPETTQAVKAIATSRLSILTGSYLSNSHEDDDHSVIVLPDFKIVHHVSAKASSAESFVGSHLHPSVPRPGLSSLTSSKTRSYPLPYRALVLICSHKRRDKRCHIAAPLLINQFYHHLSEHGLEMDERGDGLGSSDERPLEAWLLEERESKMEEALKGVRIGEGTVGVFKCSHIGGHRYAGNVIIYLPNGTSIWYGRVTPRDVGAIVQTTLIEGKVIPELLRGGLGLAGKSGSEEGVLSW